MRKIVMLLLLQCMFLLACNNAIAGIVKGRVTDSNGKPIANAKVVIEHTVFYAQYVYTTTNVNGYYSTTVPTGSWRASVQIERIFLGNTYTFDLHPDNTNAFAGKTGATRNFSWKLSGAKPVNGFYGCQVAVYPEPGSSFMMSDVIVTLTPDGPLADGSTGQSITKSLTDIGGGEDGISDVPLARYTITAKDRSTNTILKVRLRNTGEYVNSLSAIFKSGYTGSTMYQIVIQVASS